MPFLIFCYRIPDLKNLQNENNLLIFTKSVIVTLELACIGVQLTESVIHSQGSAFHWKDNYQWITQILIF